jgi:hypothetical protein
MSNLGKEHYHISLASPICAIPSIVTEDPEKVQEAFRRMIDLMSDSFGLSVTSQTEDLAVLGDGRSQIRIKKCKAHCLDIYDEIE